MSKTFDMVLTFGSLIIGFLLVIGKGGIFMKGRNEEQRKKLYDEKKVEKASGVALMLIGVATGIDSFTTSMAAKIAYVIVLVVILAAMLFYVTKKCKKK